MSLNTINQYTVSPIKNTQQGSGLIEVVVSLFILAIGLLGVLSMQAVGLRSQQRAVFVTEAQSLTEDMVNMILAFDDVGDGTQATVAGYGAVVTVGGAELPDCSGGCDRAAQVNFDSNLWSIEIEERLPGGFGQVLRKTVGDDEVLVVTVMWDDALSGTVGRNVPLDDDGDVQCPDENLACYTVELKL